MFSRNVWSLRDDMYDRQMTKRSFLSRIKVSDLPLVINWSISCASISAFHILQDNTYIPALEGMETRNLTALQFDIS